MDHDALDHVDGLRSRLLDRASRVDTFRGMADEQKDVLAATADVHDAIDPPTAVDAEELAKARLDERWREFCLNAERYVAETTRPRPAPANWPRG